MLGLHLLGIALGPVLLLQGNAVRRNTPRLAEPPGVRNGVIGEGERLRLLVVGDSAAAGVGAAQQHQAMPAQLAQNLANQFRVDWEVFAQTGETTASLLGKLAVLEARPCDVVVTSLGVNDVTAPLGLRIWCRQQRQLRNMLRRRYAARLIIVSGLPPMHRFPALPQPLRWYLGQRASAFDKRLERDVEAESDCAFLSLRFSEDAGLAASDGFHPGPMVYRQWAQRAAAIVRNSMRTGVKTGE